MFQKPFSFKGRICRTEYGISLIAYFVVLFAMECIVLLSELPSSQNALLYIMILIPTFWAILAQGSKRCHDRGNAGFYQLIPFYGFWMLFADSISGTNQYGPNPKRFANTDEVDRIGYYLVG
jgi:uncharacterized membrane protein YhaH (DUF805 family)